MTSVKKQVKRKRCSNCKRIRLVKFFSKNKKGPYGLHWWCKDCISKQSKKYNDKRRKKTLPDFICPKCGKKFKLDFYPKYQLYKWKEFRCPNCNFSPYNNE